MTSYQISTLDSLYVSVDLHLFLPPAPPPPKKRFLLRDHNGNKATKLFCVIPVIPASTPRILPYFSFYIAVQFFIVNFFGNTM